MDKAKDFEKGWEEHKAKSKQEIEEMIGIIQNAVGGCAKYWAELIAVNLRKNDYRKIPENAVVLTQEEWAEHNEMFAKAMYQKEINTRKETADKFAERLKYKDLCVPLKDEFIIICKKDIEEICRELTEGKA